MPLINALPLFQYALTELFERRDDTLLTLAAYREIGGLQRAVATRAEETYQSLDPEQQEAARQLLLRLVAVADRTETRRRALASASQGTGHPFHRAAAGRNQRADSWRGSTARGA